MRHIAHRLGTPSCVIYMRMQNCKYARFRGSAFPALWGALHSTLSTIWGGPPSWEGRHRGTVTASAPPPRGSGSGQRRQRAPAAPPRHHRQHQHGRQHRARSRRHRVTIASARASPGPRRPGFDTAPKPRSRQHHDADRRPIAPCFPSRRPCVCPHRARWVSLGLRCRPRISGGRRA